MHLGRSYSVRVNYLLSDGIESRGTLRIKVFLIVGLRIGREDV